VLVAVTALLIPTSLMGATLPTLCSYGVRRFGLVGRVVGTLYALNTLGAVAGVLASGFILIGAIGETRTILVGVAINGLVTIGALILSASRSTATPPPVDPLAAPTSSVFDDFTSPQVRHTVLVCFAISGFVTLALEIVWSRMLVLYEGTSIYAFSSMLAVILAGIGLGGFFGGRVERWKDPLLALARLEMGMALATAYSLAAFRYMDHGYGRLLMPPLILIGPAALILGIAFPVAVRCYAKHAAAIGRRVGELYAWNTIGCILGSLAGGFLLIPWIGAARSGIALAVLTIIASLALLAVHPRGIRRVRFVDAILLLATAATLLNVGDPYRDVIDSHLSDYKIYAHVEEAAATTEAAGKPDDPMNRHLVINGCGMTALITGNKLMGHLPLWIADSPRTSLVVCMGMGTTFRSVTRHPDIDVTVVEIVAAVPRFMHFYHPDADQVLAQPNAHVVVDDGRNYLLMHQRKFDTIAIDPAPPLYAAGTVNLYSREFFQLCAKRINPGGAVCLWIPPGPVSELKMIIRTFTMEFPYVSAWAGPTYPGFYLIGTLRPVTDVDARVRRGFADPRTVADLTEWDASCATPQKVLALRICDRATLLDFTSDRPVITDDHPYTEFPIWRMYGGDKEYWAGLDAMALRRWIAWRSAVSATAR
jgi:predicted membrane-bound spermidine synthase